MTIQRISSGIAVHFAPDLRVANDIVALQRERPNDRELAGVSLVVARSDAQQWSELTANVVDYLIRRQFVSPVLGRLQWTFFGATSGWRQNSAAVRHKRFWKNESLDLGSIGVQSEEIEVVSERGIRYAVVARLDRAHVRAASEWVRKTQSGFLFLSEEAPTTDSEFVRSTYSSSFAPDGASIDWSRAANCICRGDRILVRCSGAFDDQEMSVDLIFERSKFNSLITAFLAD
ncbi:hypothetical protein LK996_01720 [Lysobacter sp. A6]|uniref:Uncharacterized protein n=1 Tax=Noviluteimonas lactosilytica TaxID=2888523 RepID=A0ABS8JDW0_9GAMM|nr:hypothetical protein [Lysobacter lactosilyticus]MCC8361801.1 hypothetical protein [Lysobacter lactosilyticus]